METGTSINPAARAVSLEKLELIELLNDTEGAIDPFCTMCSSPEDQMSFFDELVSQNWNEFFKARAVDIL